MKAQNATSKEVDPAPIVAKVDEYVEDKKPVEEAKADLPGAEDGADEKAEVESWTLTEDPETSGDENKGSFQPSGEAKSRRLKNKALRGELTDTKDENTKLLERIAALEAGNAPKVPEQDQLAPRPTREQYDFDDDAYDAAVDKWNDKKLDIKLNSHYQTNQDKTQQAQSQQAATDLITKNLDSHYDNAQKLIDAGKITEDAFRNADTVVRTGMDRLFNGRGNAMTDAIISTLNNLGGGSEKVLYQLGVNPAKMQELTNLLTSDPSGLSAMGFLGSLQAKVTSPNKRRSQSPLPGSDIKGDAGGGALAGTAQKAYIKAKGNTQARITIKRKAKLDKIDTSNW